MASQPSVSALAGGGRLAALQHGDAFAPPFGDL